MASGRTKVTTDQVAAYLKLGKRTVRDVASKFSVTPATARKHVQTLVLAGNAAKIGARPLGTRGRSPDLFSVLS